MSSPPFNLPPEPVLPLSYFEGHNTPHAAGIRFLSWVGISFGILSIASVLASLTLTYMQVRGFFRNPGLSGPTLYSGLLILIQTLPALAAAALVHGSQLTLRLRRAGRKWVTASSISLIAIGVLGYLTNTLWYVFGRPSFFTSEIVLLQSVNGFFQMLSHSFLPAVLWIAFTRRQVRETLDRA